MLGSFEEGMSFNHYRESVAELLSPFRTSGHFRDLPHQAYEARAASKVRRVGLAHTIASRLLRDEVGHAQSRLYEAEALHIVSVPLSSEISPAELIALLIPCTARLKELRRQNPELGRYCGLIERTVSMAASKLDRYTAAFDRINRAHLALSDAPQDRQAMTREEALQQLYLQECGQLVRNVEAALIEQDPILRAQLRAGQPPTKTLRQGSDLRTLRIVARAGAEAGARACRLLDTIAAEAGLPSHPNPEERRLATASWYLTANIMYIRSLLLAATVELSAGNAYSQYLRDVPDLYARIIEVPPAQHLGSSAAPLKSHVLDLTRIALHWSFLNQGSHPYLPKGLSFGIRPGVPPHLIHAVDGHLDAAACSAFLGEHSHDAGILDILAHVETYRLFNDRGGTGAHGYFRWLENKRPRHASATDDVQADHDTSRKTQRPTYGLLARSARMILRSGRYRDVLQGV
ncbi:hypothetical protein [Nocardia farcinica]|uniref:hypothetical protein n=1 Tax=Nocardia farcinica TaxID=37329 RepID=UPI0024546140|nr:hypothetical protein [Nocardia farcinica]